MLFAFIIIAAAAGLIIGLAAVFSPGQREGGRISGNQALGVVRIDGLILDSAQVVKWVRELKDEPKIKGVLIRVDSPGGLIAPSQEIKTAVQDLAQVKPVVVSMGQVAASGGYYVSCPATVIYANPGTITASIGVKMELTNIQDLLDFLGVSKEILVSGKFKDAGSPYRPMTDEERQYFNSIITDLHEQFVTDVAAARKMSVEEVAALADGRVMTGRQAVDAGLVDMLGGLDQAMERLRNLAGVDKDAPIIEGPKEHIPILRRLLGSVEINLDGPIYGPRWLYQY